MSGCRCLQGAKYIRGGLDSLWPDVSPVPYDALRDQEICPGTQFKVRRLCAQHKCWDKEWAAATIPLGHIQEKEGRDGIGAGGGRVLP